MNKIILFGRLVRDCDVRYTQSGKVVCQFTIAVDRPFNKDGQKEADFIPVVLWGKQAEVFANNLSKGSSVLVCGKVRTGSYTDKNGGKRYTTDVWVDEFSFTEKRNSQAQSGGGFADMGTPFDAGEVSF